MKNKKAGLQGTIWGVVVVVLIVMVGAVVYLKQPTAPLSITTSSGDIVTTTNLGVSCPSGSSTNVKVRAEDKAASTTTYAANLIAYMNYVSGGNSPQKLVTMANTSASDYSSATAVQCNELLPVVYSPILVEHKKGDATTYGYLSGLGINDKVTIAGDTVFVDFMTKRTDTLKATIKDKNNQDKYLNATKTRGTTTGFEALNNTWADQPGQSSLTIAADGYFDLELQVKTNNTRNVFGNVLSYNSKLLRTIVAIDADSTDWQEPVVSGGGISKINKGDLATEDQSVLSAYEYFYTVDSIKDTDTIFRWYQQSKSGVNPSMDPKWRFIAEGLYKSVKSPDTIQIGAFDDSSSNLELTSSTNLEKQEITIDIS